MEKQSGLKCYLCGCNEQRHRPGRVRDNEKLDILECQRCGLVFISLSRAPQGFYEQSGMHNGDPQPIDQWLRDTDRDDERRFCFLSEAITNRDVLDFGCGVGGFLQKARAKARSVLGIELESRLIPYFQDNGLEVLQRIEDLPSNQLFDVITAFHVLEHLEDPADMLSQLAMRLRAGGRIIVELPSSADALLTLYESKPFSEFTYWSCHLYLFSSNNLSLLVKKAGLKLEFINHIQRYPLSNHLHWLSKGKPGGHQAWNFLDSDDLARAYEARLAGLGLTDTLFASLSR